MNEGERLKGWLTERRISNVELAKKLEVSKGAVSSFLSGRNSMSMETFKKLLGIFPDLCANWVLMGDGHQSSCKPKDPEKEIQSNRKDEEIKELRKMVALQETVIELINDKFGLKIDDLVEKLKGNSRVRSELPE